MSDLKNLRQVSRTIENDTRRPFLQRCCPNVRCYLLGDGQKEFFSRLAAYPLMAQGVQTLSIEQQPSRRCHSNFLGDHDTQIHNTRVSRLQNASAVAATLTGEELAVLLASMPNVRKLTLTNFDDAVLEKLLPAVAEIAAALHIKELTVYGRLGIISCATLVSVLNTFGLLEALKLYDIHLAHGAWQSVFAYIHDTDLKRLNLSDLHKADGSWVVLGVEGDISGREYRERRQKFWRANGSIQQYLRQGWSLSAHGSDAVKASVARVAGRQHPHAGED